MLTVNRSVSGRKQSFWMIDEDSRVLYDAHVSEWAGPIDIAITDGQTKILSLCFSMDLTSDKCTVFPYADLFDPEDNYVGSIRLIHSGILFKKKHYEVKVSNDTYIFRENGKNTFSMSFESEPKGHMTLADKNKFTVESDDKDALFFFIFCVAFLFRNPCTN